jgi:hypothetical protein
MTFQMRIPYPFGTYPGGRREATVDVLTCQEGGIVLISHLYNRG